MITIIFFNNFKIADTYLGQVKIVCLICPQKKNPFLGLCTKRFGNIIWTEILTVLKILKYKGSRGAWFLRNSVFQFLFRILGNIKCQIV